MKMKVQINKALVPMKAHYFLFNAGTGPVVPYLTVYARQLGFSSVVVGLVYTILPVCGMIAKPVFGAIADRFKCQKILFLIAQLLTAAAFLALFFSTRSPLEAQVSLNCAHNQLTIQNLDDTTVDSKLLAKIQSKQQSTTCELTCQMTAKDLTTLCHEWKLMQYCDKSSDDLVPRLVYFSSQVPLHQTIFLRKQFNVAKNVSEGNIGFKVESIRQNEQVLSPNCSGSTTLKSTCNMGCNDTDVNALLLNAEIPDNVLYGTYQFWAFLLLMITAWVGQAIAVSIGDTICFEMLGDKPNRYGYQRMFGALGWGILSLLTGVLVDVISRDNATTDYSICFYLSTAFLLLDFIASTQLKYTQTKLSTNIIKDIGKLLLNIRIIVFLVWCICVGMCTGLIWQFLLWLVEDLANARGETRIKTLQGVIMGVQCLGGELPFFFLSGKILKKIGHINAMTLVLFGLGIRFILYSVIVNPWWFIPIEFSNGLTFGIFYACMASYASIAAPTGTEATMQGLVGAVFEGVGVSLGSLLAGWAMSNVSGAMTFRFFGLGALAAAGIHIIVQILLRTSGRQDASPVVERKNSFEKVRLEDQQELTIAEPLILR
ncbi:major facilitator superfamily domain-containing protein 6 [Anthonomus grandis grandis]|uniref:major facilitator superfamily domain-containing protein 6 n=1 Tax=Anthonomus grandis grandis TaxID=2921223 RepID=UPI0021651C05|nr:major facilitator superfamily domain-containing protein 6 [Anthonomus grandis grandis]